MKPNPAYVPLVAGRPDPPSAASKLMKGGAAGLGAAAVATSAQVPEFVPEQVLITPAQKIPAKASAYAPAAPMAPPPPPPPTLVRKNGFVFTRNADGSLTPTDAAASAMKRQALTGGDGMDRSAAGDNSPIGAQSEDTSHYKWGPTKPFADMRPDELARWNAKYDENGYERPKVNAWQPGQSVPGTGGPALSPRPNQPVTAGVNPGWRGPGAALSGGQPTAARTSQIYRSNGYIFAPNGRGGHTNIGRDHAASRVGGRW